MARKRATLSDLLNDLTLRCIFDKFRLMATNLFEWDGLPEGIDEKFVERYLFDYGKAIFFRDPDMDYMCLRAEDSGHFNVYGEGISYWATGFNYHKLYSTDDAVIIENNDLRLATRDFVLFYVNKITEAERTMDVNVKAVKTPYIITCDDKDVLTFKRIFQMIDGNVPAIYADRGLNIDSINALQTGVSFLCNDLMDYKTSVENELLTFLGVNNVPTDKKERLITDEAKSNDQLICGFLSLQLSAREKACERINDMFGLNVSVSPRNKPEEVKTGAESIDDKVDR